MIKLKNNFGSILQSILPLLYYNYVHNNVKIFQRVVLVIFSVTLTMLKALYILYYLLLTSLIFTLQIIINFYFANNNSSANFKDISLVFFLLRQGQEIDQ